jgi:hypothetical protein
VPNAVSRFWRSLTREQKLSVGLLGLCAFVALIMGAVQIRRNIIYPFTAPVDQLVKIKNLFGPTDAEKEAKAKLTDTDKDGLSDWDEENRYHTSPYNTDTDSDGISDDVEIARGTDPNCPQGQNCGYVYTPPAENSAGGSTETASASSTYGNVLPLVPNRDPATIRAYLKAQGVSEAQLSSYTDDMLLQAYDQSVTDFQSSSSTGAGSTSTPLTPTSGSGVSASPTFVPPSISPSTYSQ